MSTLELILAAFFGILIWTFIILFVLVKIDIYSSNAEKRQPSLVVASSNDVHQTSSNAKPLSESRF